MRHGITRWAAAPIALIMAVALAAAASGIVAKTQAQAPNRTVGLVASYHELQRLALRQGLPLDQLLSEFKSAGLEGLVIGEDILSGLVDEGRVTRVKGPNEDYFLVSDPDLFQRLSQTLAPRFPDQVTGVYPPAAADPPAAHEAGILTVRDPTPQLLLYGVGYPADTIARARALGFSTYFYVRRPQDLTTAELQDLLSRVVADDGLAGVLWEGNAPGDGPAGLFEGERGRRLAAAVRDGGPAFGLIEFRDASTFRRWGPAIDYRIIRTYERPPGEAVLEYLLAARDRGVRLVFFRIALDGEEGTAGANLDHLAKVARQLAAAGFSTGTPAPFTRLPVNIPRSAAVAGGIILGAVAMMRELFPRLDGRTPGILWLGGFCLSLAGLAVWTLPVLKILAFLGAVVYPPLGLAWAIGYADRTRPGEPLRGLRAFACATLVTLAGGILVHGLLASEGFLLKVEEFAGVRAAYVLSLALAAVLLYRRYGIRRRWDGWSLLLAVGGLVALLILMNRTGNTTSFTIPVVEVKLRQWLEVILGYRPRTKEFLIGHPALLLGLTTLVGCRLRPGRSLPRWFPLAILGGAIGQSSMFNSFQHLHTPFAIILARTLIGLALGILIGTVLSCLACRAEAGRWRGVNASG